MPADHSDRLTRAITIATQSHSGQLYGSDPYILHPLRVMLGVRKELRVIAVLHDVLEDSRPDIALDLLWLSPSELKALQLLTRQPGVGYSLYIDRLCADGTVSAEPEATRAAMLIKIADMRDNLFNSMTLSDSLRKRYIRVCETLAIALEQHRVRYGSDDEVLNAPGLSS